MSNGQPQGLIPTPRAGSSTKLLKKRAKSRKENPLRTVRYPPRSNQRQMRKTRTRRMTEFPRPQHLQDLCQSRKLASLPKHQGQFQRPHHQLLNSSQAQNLTCHQTTPMKRMSCVTRAPNQAKYSIARETSSRPQLQPRGHMKSQGNISRLPVSP